MPLRWMMMRNADPEALMAGAGASYLGVFFVVVVALGAGGGIWLDNHFHKTPLFTIVGLFLGVAAGMREMFKVLKETNASTATPGSRTSPVNSSTIQEAAPSDFVRGKTPSVSGSDQQSPEAMKPAGVVEESPGHPPADKD